MYIKFLVIVLVMILPFFAKSQTVTKSFYNQVESGYNFLLNIPDEYADSTGSMPLIVFLHGRSLSGSDLNRVKKYGVLDAINRTKINPHAFVVAPQCPRSESWDPDRVLNVMNWVKANYKIDSNRIYVVGMSLGGYGTFDFAGKYPNEISAAVALCGGGKEKYASNLATVPLWIMHGLADRAVPASQSQKMEDAINAASPTNFMRADYFRGLDHGDMVHVFYMPDMYRWLYQFDGSDSNKTKINNFDITLADFKKRPIDGDHGEYWKQKSADNDTLISNQGNAAYKAVEMRDTTTINVTKEEVAKPEIKTKPTPKTKVHTVKQGDTLWAIAKKYGTTVEKICHDNNIKENSILSLGQKLKIK